MRITALALGLAVALAGCRGAYGGGDLGGAAAVSRPPAVGPAAPGLRPWAEPAGSAGRDL